MAVTLVYTGEHYVADIAAGWLVAVVAVVVARVTVEPSRSGAYGRSSGPDQGPDREDP